MRIWLKLLISLYIILHLIVTIGLFIRTEQLQAQVDTYRVLIFNLYGENGG